MHAVIAYRRVSTEKQGRSGLGLDAQAASIDAYVRMTGASVLATFTDVESGKVDDRPQLLAAIAAAKAANARLVVATLDRLSRDLHFIAGLMKTGVDFVAADMPGASTFELHIRAAIAQEERRKISERTRHALAAAKARGTKLGGFRGAVPTDESREAAAHVRAGNADAFAAKVRPALDALQSSGITSLKGLAAALNAKGITTRRGGAWSATQVARLLERCA